MGTSIFTITYNLNNNNQEGENDYEDIYETACEDKNRILREHPLYKTSNNERYSLSQRYITDI